MNEDAPMATHEREITAAVDLCAPNGTLNPDARGWSRVPLHRANLQGKFGRNKRWDYWGILAGDLLISSTFSNVDYLGIVDVWWADLATGRTGGRARTVPFPRDLALPECPGTAPLRSSSKSLTVEMIDDEIGTHLRASWIERDGTPGRLDATVELPAGHESLNVVIPWSETTFQFTSKHQARPAHGELVLGDDVRRFGDDGSAWGVLDVGRLTKVGDELEWDYRWDDPMHEWRVRAPDGSIDLALHPRYDKHSRTEVRVMGMEVHQVFGHWSGSVRTDEGVTVAFDGMQGFAEECRARW